MTRQQPPAAFGVWPASLPYRDDHEMLRETARRFFTGECAPHREAWEEAGMVPRDIWRRAGELGLLCPRIDPEYGGSGGDLLHAVVLTEEQVRAGVVAPVISLHNDVVAPYLAAYGTEAQKARVLPRMATGEWIGAIAMTEPSAGSDLRAMKTRARREGDSYVVSGQKTFISHGATADIVVLAAQADAGISLFLVEVDGLEGFARGAPLDKMGQLSADTAELFFDEVRLPATALLGGEEGRGFIQLGERLVEERLMTGVVAQAFMESAIDHTIAYTRERKAFGQRVIDFQNSRFRLAEARTEAVVCRTFLERCIRKFMDGRLDATEAAMLKWWSTEQQNRIIDACVQLHGGYGYMLEYPISRMWLDSRVAKIYGGANEIMKDIIGRAL
ncbi:MAG: acyl-CoA dehydrogenase [Phenylobacterium sp.]|uniref:acyl-CoA dehydrogenase family protein n=1 Tax=Phenylobacterium sp. TaxID=1871053 RepID=UPI0025D02A90|nr:acyl-CoA dehydrogenase family protein [Phenylobacterium sp.]MBI1199273.1 acyl-CoA dehydrogenase [Phenylobacterium sp.]